MKNCVSTSKLERVEYNTKSRISCNLYLNVNCWGTLNDQRVSESCVFQTYSARQKIHSFTVFDNIKDICHKNTGCFDGCTFTSPQKHIIDIIISLNTILIFLNVIFFLVTPFVPLIILTIVIVETVKYTEKLNEQSSYITND